jgi:hypothetical protein
MESRQHQLSFLALFCYLCVSLSLTQFYFSTLSPTELSYFTPPEQKKNDSRARTVLAGCLRTLALVLHHVTTLSSHDDRLVRLVPVLVRGAA